MNSGIYCITCSISDHKYVGQSKDLYKRKNGHFNALKNNKHKNKHLQNAYNKYGVESFSFSILCYCEPVVNALNKMEQFWIDALHPIYNKAPVAGSPLGVKMSEEAKRKMSESRKGEKGSFWGKNHTEETKKKMSLAKIGKKFSESHKNNMSISRKGKPFSEEHKNKIANSMRGHKNALGHSQSDETKKRMSVSKTGINNPFFGKEQSKETRQKISESKKEWWQRKRNQER